MIVRALLALALILGAVRAEAAEKVDVALVLAVDVSGSIDVEEFLLQRHGYAGAFRDPRLIASILGGRHRRIAVTMMEWAGARGQAQVIPWTLVDGRDSARALADALERTPRRVFGGTSTSISGAIDAGVRLLERSGYEAEREVIDVSGDGHNNAGRPAGFARDDAVVKGIVINGLAILTDDGILDVHYRDHVIGGPGAFVLGIETYGEFARAILAKLIREIAEAPAERVNAAFILPPPATPGVQVSPRYAPRAPSARAIRAWKGRRRPGRAGGRRSGP